MLRAVPEVYLSEPPSDRDELAIRAGRHVAASQHAGKLVWSGLELEAQYVGNSPFFRFNDGIGVMGDQPA